MAVLDFMFIESNLHLRIHQVLGLAISRSLSNLSLLSFLELLNLVPSLSLCRRAPLGCCYWFLSTCIKLLAARPDYL